MVEKTGGAAEKRSDVQGFVGAKRLAELRKRLDNLETAYQQLRRSPQDWQKQHHQELAALGRHVGDLHRKVKNATPVNLAWWKAVKIIKGDLGKIQLRDIKFNPATAKITAEFSTNLAELEKAGP